MKRCSKCKDWKPRSEFGKNRRESDGCQAYCKPCSSARVCEWQRQRRGELREKIFDLLGRVCCKCGFADIRALQFDHRNGDGYLDRDFSRHCGTILYFKKILANIESFQVLCANCNWIKRIENDEGYARKSKQALSPSAS